LQVDSRGSPGFENHSGQTYFDPEISVESLEQSVSQLTASGIASELELESKLKSLNSTAKPLAKVVFGYGNNSQQKLEGCVVNRAIGTYMHGPCLAKNPKLADWFIEPVLRRKNLNVKQSVDDSIVNVLREQLVHRFI
jgi:Predicted glutamine amidotransferase